MKVSELISQIEAFQSKLIEHQKLWGASLTIPDFPIRNREALEEQTRWLARRLGALRPYTMRQLDCRQGGL
jgi:hypothetical protein